jgi:2-polyprenyl-3-methyl-5-hydroxy-6-metoxy-1,4-benzoquinol methylase
MTELLDAEGITSTTYLDVGSCYGWYVAQMLVRGFDARGIELDPKAVRLGEVAYGLDTRRIEVGECSELLRTTDRHDVVSCFSVLHHFAMGAGPCSAEELARLLDRVTGRVLFFDTGQSHEAWFRDLLPAWNIEYIVEWLRSHTTFRRVMALGVDHDDVEPFADNYGRMLFACVR